ncbi:unnamed protein product [Polarella glacialis]|uniref:Uncharacterized protein n=1 Tax=Polarella glacialis TaxID=89957 RepID=A0A813HE47_POLGL|nr:unnamed protein product [Polarella glacialis]
MADEAFAVIGRMVEERDGGEVSPVAGGDAPGDGDGRVDIGAGGLRRREEITRTAALRDGQYGRADYQGRGDDDMNADGLNGSEGESGRGVCSSSDGACQGRLDGLELRLEEIAKNVENSGAAEAYVRLTERQRIFEERITAMALESHKEQKGLHGAVQELKAQVERLADMEVRMDGKLLMSMQASREAMAAQTAELKDALTSKTKGGKKAGPCSQWRVRPGRARWCEEYLAEVSEKSGAGIPDSNEEDGKFSIKGTVINLGVNKAAVSAPVHDVRMEPNRIDWENRITRREKGPKWRGLMTAVFLQTVLRFGEAVSSGPHTLLVAEGLSLPAPMGWVRTPLRAFCSSPGAKPCSVRLVAEEAFAIWGGMVEERDGGEVAPGVGDADQEGGSGGVDVGEAYADANYGGSGRSEAGNEERIEEWEHLPGYEDWIVGDFNVFPQSGYPYENMRTNELLRHAAAGLENAAPGPKVVIPVFSCSLGQLSGYLDQRTQGWIEAGWLHFQWTGEFAIVQVTIYKSQWEEGVRKWRDVAVRLMQNCLDQLVCCERCHEVKFGAHNIKECKKDSGKEGPFAESWGGTDTSSRGDIKTGRRAAGLKDHLSWAAGKKGGSYTKKGAEVQVSPSNRFQEEIMMGGVRPLSTLGGSDFKKKANGFLLMYKSEAEERIRKAGNMSVDALVILTIGQVRGFELIHAVTEGSVMEEDFDEDEMMREVFRVADNKKRYVVASDGVSSGGAKPSSGGARTGEMKISDENGAGNFLGYGGSWRLIRRIAFYLRTTMEGWNNNAGRIGVNRRKAEFRPGGHRWPGGSDGVCRGVAGVVNYEKKTDVPESRHQGRRDWRARGPGTGRREGGEAGGGWCGHSVMEFDRRLVSFESGLEDLAAFLAESVGKEWTDFAAAVGATRADALESAVLRSDLDVHEVHARRENLTVRPSEAEAHERRLSADSLRRVSQALEQPGPQTFVLESDRREHILLNPFSEVNVTRALVQLGVQCGEGVGGFLAQLVPCGSSLTELAAIVVRRGAEEQDYHPDTARRVDDARSFTAFVALQKTTSDMGPLWVRPRSHVCWGEEALRLPLPVGAMVLMDSRLWHRGGEHAAGGARAVFYLSWAEPPATPSQQLPGGTTFALRPELWGRMRVPLPPWSPAGREEGRSICGLCETSGPLDSVVPLRTWGMADFLAVQLASCNAANGAKSWDEWQEWLDCVWSDVMQPFLRFGELRAREQL